MFEQYSDYPDFERRLGRCCSDRFDPAALEPR